MAETSLSLTFQDNSNREAAFLVERKQGAGAYSQVAQLDAAHDPEPTIVAYTDTGLTEATQYTYRVRARNAGGNSAYSNEATGMTLPTAPSTLTALAVSSSEIDLAWTNHSSGATGYKIERKLGAGSYSQIATVGPGTNTFNDTGLSSGSTYTYRVRAYDAGGNSAYTNEAAATTSAGGLDPTAMFFHHDMSLLGLSGGVGISDIPDQTGNGRDWIQNTGGNQFLYEPAIQNGLGVARSPDQSRFMTIPGFTLGRPGAPTGGRTFYFVTNYTTSGVEQFLLSAQSVNGGFSCDASETDNHVGIFQSHQSFLEGPIATTGWQVLTFVFDWANGELRIYRNGARIFTQGGLVSGNDIDSVWTLGGQGGVVGLLGDIGEDVGYSTPHDDAAVASNAGVLQSKWGI